MKKICFLAVLLSLFTALPAEEYLLYDFENYEIGTKFNLKNVPGRPVGEGSYAVVAADPTDSNNKVLHVLLVNSWDTYPEYPLPDGFTAADFCTYQSVAFSLYRPQVLPKNNDYMQTAVWLGDKKVYQEEHPNYPDQGPRDTWLEKRYAFTPVETEASNFLLGLHSDNMEYYLDNIRLVRAEKGYDYTDETQTLRYYVEKCGNGKHVGVATPSSWKNVIDLNNDLHDMSQTVFRNFNMVVAEDNMKFAYIEPSQGNFEFGYTDALVAFAERHGMEVRGHTLCWHKQLPDWVTTSGDRNSHNYSSDSLLSILRNHITTIVSRYKGKIAEWDVVNECLADNQENLRNPANKDKYFLRPSVWSKGIGAKLEWSYDNTGGDFIDSAFVYAHRADPDAKLFLNDYGVECGGRKADAYYNLAKHLIEKKIPIHGVGLQCHFDAGVLDSAGLVRQIQRFQELGLEVVITELDIASSGKQADEFRTIANIFMEQENCSNMVLWGVSDRDSWRNSSPLLFDADLAAKPAFFAVRDALKRQYVLSVAPVPNDARPQSPYVDVYNLAGQKIASGMRRESVNFLPTGIYIVDGEKVMVR